MNSRDMRRNVVVRRLARHLNATIAAAMLVCASLGSAQAWAATASAADTTQSGAEASVAPGAKPASTASASKAGSKALAAQPSTPLPPSLLYGPLYRDVELARVYPDSKTFADCVPTRAPREILRRYHVQRAVRGFELKHFVDTYFRLPPRPPTHAAVGDKMNVTAHIQALWGVLKREPDRDISPWSSLLALPNAYIVPGDRFDEIYYWDSYFILLGLEQDGQHELALDELNNFAHLIDRYGHIPNGNRSYYLSRSQPPFFAAMVQLIADHDGDQVYVQYLPELEKEYAYWMTGADSLKPGQAAHHVVRLPDGTVMNRYWDERSAPRDESYREDIDTAHSMPQRDSADLWRNLRAGAESGWDFSSRWFADGKTLATIEVTSLIPADLNTLMYNLERTLAVAHHAKGDAGPAARYQKLADARAAAIRSLLWDEKTHAFGDYDFVHHQLTHRLSAATVYPLYFGVATRDQAQTIAQTVEHDLLRPGGIATTSVQSGQQWDEPNGWAPLQFLAVIGLRRYGQDTLARTIATRWIASNLAFYNQTGKLVEKYDLESDKPATGGEYALQEGFGWTNGVLASLLALYPDAGKLGAASTPPGSVVPANQATKSP